MPNLNLNHLRGPNVLVSAENQVLLSIPIRIPENAKTEKRELAT
jgi:hypothetical protein